MPPDCDAALRCGDFLRPSIDPQHTEWHGLGRIRRGLGKAYRAMASQPPDLSVKDHTQFKWGTQHTNLDHFATGEGHCLGNCDEVCRVEDELPDLWVDPVPLSLGGVDAGKISGCQPKHEGSFCFCLPECVVGLNARM